MATSTTLRVTLAQINPKVGDLKANTRHIIEIIEQHQNSTDLLVFPELCITGYPPEDLLLREDFIAATQQYAQQIVEACRHCTAIIGLPEPGDKEESTEQPRLFNALWVISDQSIHARYHKRFLPNYAVFDEKRYFTPGTSAMIVEIKGVPFGLTICEDIWQPEPALESAELGAHCLISINASPFHYRKSYQREQAIIKQRAVEAGLPIIYLNQIGGQDELVFDGSSFICDSQGDIIARMPVFEECVSHFELELSGKIPSLTQQGLASSAEQASHDLAIEPLVYRALVVGVRDYVTKNGFKRVILGLSGGIDSALVAAIAADALGPDQVEAIMLPYRYTSDMSQEDAASEAQALGISYRILPINGMVNAALDTLSGALTEGHPGDTTEENLQARSRGLLLMALSNHSGAMLLTTGNKSEMAVGYATLYGDMAGGFAVIKDVPKTLVYRLARYRNTLSPVIPERVITRPPSAELKPDQTDQDSLPDYDILDDILEQFIEKDHSPDQIIASGHAPELVNQVVKRVVVNEYKRRQAAPGVRITPRAFGRDRRYPITSGFF